MTHGCLCEFSSMRHCSAWASLLFLLFISGCSSSFQFPRWEFTGGPSAQNVSTLAVDEANKARLMAGLTSGHVFTSTNEGLTWEKLSTIRPNTAINGFVQHPHNAGWFFALTDSGIFVSKDSGAHWHGITLGDSASYPASRTLVIDPYNADVMYAGTSGRGIYKTTDAGKSWSQRNAGLDSLSLLTSDVDDLKIDPSKPDNIFGAIRGIGVVKSSDGGANWTKLATILGTGGITPTSIVIHPRSPGTICFGMEAGNIYRTDDGGITWSPTHVGTGGSHPVSLVGDPGNIENIYAGTESDLLISTDFGASWTSISKGLPRIGTSIAVSPGRPDPVLFAYGEGIGLMRSTDQGSSWLPRQAQLGGSTVTVMAGDERGSVLYAAAGTSVHRWSPPAHTWTPASKELTGGPITSLTVGADSASIVHVATATGILSTRDSGNTWTTGVHQLRGRRASFISAHPIFVTRILANAEDEMLVSTDRGSTWSPTKPVTARYHVLSFTYSPNDAGLVFGAATKGGVIVSTDGGLSWEKSGYGLPSVDVDAVTLDDKDRQTLYAWTDTGEGYRSTNKGLVWDRYSPPWHKGGQIRIVFDRAIPSEVIALAGTIYYSRSGGGTWFAIPADTLQGEITSAYWNSQTATLYAGIRHVGVYRLVLREYLKRLFSTDDDQ